MIRLTLQHWYGFTAGVRVASDGPLTEEEWVRLRERDTAFGFGTSREDWIAGARANSALVERAAAVAELLRNWSSQRLVSVGVGTGVFEFLLKSSAPGLKIRAGDWGDESLQLLQERFKEADSIERMDLREPTWFRDPDETVLLNRVDMELGDVEWSHVFSDLAERGARRIVWIPAGLLTPGSMLTEIRGVLVGLGMRRHLQPAGYLRTPARMMELFSDHYARREVIKRGDLPAWGLHLRAKG
jgi:hypothetical protein